MTIEPAEDEAEIGPERSLALVYAPAAKRDALRALWQVDARMRRLFTSGREPMLREVRLAWWQERMAELTLGSAPAEPLLQRLALYCGHDDVASRLSALAEAWRSLIGDYGWTAQMLDEYARLRGDALIALGANFLGGRANARMGSACQGQALVDLAPLAIDDAARAMASDLARRRYAEAGRLTWPRALRPMGMIVEIDRSMSIAGNRSVGSPKRIIRMAWHALSGR